MSAYQSERANALAAELAPPKPPEPPRLAQARHILTATPPERRQAVYDRLVRDAPSWDEVTALMVIAREVEAAEADGTDAETAAAEAVEAAESVRAGESWDV